MNKVEIVHFNPQRRVFKGKLGHLLRFKRPLNNFGDLLGPLVVDYMKEYGDIRNHEAKNNTRLLTIGSILHFAKDKDVIWGTGINGKIPSDSHTFTNLDVRAVRGPLTRDFLIQRGINTPEIYGDPGLLIPLVFPHLQELSEKPKFEYTFIPNYNDIQFLDSKKNVFNPRSGMMRCLERIAQSKFVIGSSLHAIIIADALGIPARLIKSNIENEFKYSDYYYGTGRMNFNFARNLDNALELGGEKQINYQKIINPLLASFPFDLWN